MTALAEGRKAGILTPEQSWTLIVYCRWYEISLGRHGFTVERLEKLAQRVASDQCKLRGAQLQERMEDLVSRLVMAGLQASQRYDPLRQQASYGRNGGEPFSSYLADIFERRAVDFWRSKGEGFGDRRRGMDDCIDLTDNFDSVEPVSFDVRDNERAYWQEAAGLVDMDLDSWIVNALNRAAKAGIARAEGETARQIEVAA